MAKVVNLFDSGRRSIRKGVVKVNSYNVYPSTITAVPTSGTLIPAYLFDSYEFFKVAQTNSATNDFVVIPDAIDVGTQFLLYAISTCEMGTQTSAVGLNAGGGNDHISIPANSTAVCLKTATNNIVVHILDDDGTIDIPSLTS